MKKIVNEGNLIHNFMSSSGSGTVISYGSGSDFLQVTVPVPLVNKLRFLRFRFRFHNTDILTSASALEMSGMLPRMVITRSRLYDDMSEIELTVTFVLVS